MYIESTQHNLYSDILNALATAKQLGRMEERYANRGKTNLISKRKATELFGTEIVNRYHEQYGIPDATGTKANSTRQYSFTRLNELVEAEKIEEAIVRFEVKVRTRQKYATKDTIQQWIENDGGREWVAKGLPLPNRCLTPKAEL